jgi:hypothetical protein
LPSQVGTAAENVPVPVSIVDVIGILQNNATRARRTGHVFIGATLIIGVCILLLFLYFTQFICRSIINKNKGDLPVSI